MSYDVFIELPKPLRNKPKRGEYPPAALERLEQISAALHRIDPTIEIEREDALLSGSSKVLGVFVADPNRLSLRYTSARGYHAVLMGMQRALAELEPLGFEGYDPQIGARIHHFAERADFLRQFRSQFMCPDDEFEEWLQGREPAAWKRWRELQESAGSRYAAASFPPLPDFPDWQAVRAMDPDSLQGLLKRLIALNDQRIRELELGEFLQQSLLRDPLRERRGNGEWLPFRIWSTSLNSLDQEREIMGALITRGWPAVIFDQPQQLTIVVDANRSADPRVCNTRADLLREDLRRAIPGLPDPKRCCESWCDFVGRTEIECEDPDLVLTELMPTLQRYRDLPIQIRRRYGWHGAREVESSLSE